MNDRREAVHAKDRKNQPKQIPRNHRHYLHASFPFDPACRGTSPKLYRLRADANVASGCNASEVPCAGRAEATSSAERVLQKLDIADLAVRHPGEQREGRSNLLAQCLCLVGKASEHRDASLQTCRRTWDSRSW